MIVVTGGAGFIGANFVLDWASREAEPVVNVDKLTYAGSRSTLHLLQARSQYGFVEADICNRVAMDHVFEKHRPRAIVHFAAESHVDRSIRMPAEFIQSNVVGTFTLLQAAHRYWLGLGTAEKRAFRFLHVSTDEVFGSLGPHDAPFSEQSPYAPNSPYSATKAASDHLVRAWHHTFGLPTLTTHCSNNYGPFQFPEKLIPLMIRCALEGNSLPIYGDGQNVRDWLYVGDHCSALRQVLAGGVPGRAYNIGGRNELTNLDVVGALCDLLDRFQPRRAGSYREQIRMVSDRPGHDRRYAIDATRMQTELGWMPTESFETGLEKTVRWYLDHQRWVNEVACGEYQKWEVDAYAKQA
ncbi:dTDP-glucose 4,6-dehydratase [Burkholderia gladioli]|jgi:dTDP-glucose 4,6-dehydratase|uniref:dTDP-glucose 4,6-dehydratase n=1 Tax=Burkholderia gladioli TaxID=28095 RepID=A0AAW3F000_BURGA|nr:dTDP-glucose 4,6-dehydratase [Burkholderia gladioli]AJW94175.1 dTDP-glucose 4,6-dehydratase [Burkholderia gladioli]ASD81847.1 dTDP-glucose 4,6-dehydratase [Burkholderia gladioli pv. gladioli]AWY52098.1 dTDP-glucose 4,6-dehydratase [Burkholderia gladioli pv. gladioli]KGC13131.1 dTDP-glucose 4,6-dehydratase [Burkholderia gladioli]MDJ1165572.1 dTDP-glucose 4,6-dehydratase [Burkholderia gladioli pv. gladioli]